MCQSAAQGGRRCASSTRAALARARDVLGRAAGDLDRMWAQDAVDRAMVAHAQTRTGRAELAAVAAGPTGPGRDAAAAAVAAADRAAADRAEFCGPALGMFQGRFAPEDADWMGRLRPRALERAAAEPRWAELRRELLSRYGGHEVVPGAPEDPDVDKALARGRAFDGDQALTAPGEPNQCHANSAALWQARRDDGWSIATGHAASEDGVWREHTWCVDEQGRPVETTVGRVVYFGYVMDDAEAEAFCEENW